ncbi:hypothetical protein WN943_017324 [Citrus x changshan-huyou]
MAASAEEERGEFVYRISTASEWEELQKNGSTFGGELDKSSGCFHLSKLDQVQPTLQNFFLNSKEDLYLLQIDAKKLLPEVLLCVSYRRLTMLMELLIGYPNGKLEENKLGDGLIYELVDGLNSFPHFYGPSRSFAPLPLDVVTKADKLSLSDGRFSCSLLN